MTQTTAPGLDADELIQAARDRTGLDDLGPGTFREGLDRLLDGLQTEARLNDIGRAISPENLLPPLTNRLQLVDWHSRHPEIGAADVGPVVAMIGQGRTGTTILHDLLAQDPTNRVPRTWETDLPFPPPETATYDTDPRIAEVQARIDAAGAARPELQAMHPMGAQLAQECIRMTASEFVSLIFLSQYRSPSYLGWLTTEADHGPAYRLHRQFLQLLQWRAPGDRWVIKSGAHQWALPALVAEYPDAWFVQTHRDPVRVIASLSSLFAAIQSTFSDETTIAEVASEWAGPILDALDRSVTAREDGTVPAARVVDVQYAAFMANPIGEVHRIYDLLGVDLNADVETRMRTFLAEHRAGPARRPSLLLRRHRARRGRTS